jgi:hypothetical protein
VVQFSSLFNRIQAQRAPKKAMALFLALSLSCFATLSATDAALNYPNFKDNPFLDKRMQSSIAPFLLPLDHPIKPMLDSIFSTSRAIENERTLVDAGFTVIAGPMPFSFIIVARHPAVPGFVFKVYLDSESRLRKQIPHWKWLVRRCIGARGIRNVIKHENIRYFLVPDKWLYVLPVYPYSNVLNPQPIILVETDMEPESHQVSEHMWKTAVRSKHLDELYSILKQGYGGSGTLCLSHNVPYTKSGKFAFTDTEDRRADLKLTYIKKYLSKDMQHYWDSLINQ